MTETASTSPAAPDDFRFALVAHTCQPAGVSARMRRDVVDYLYGNLSRFQEYDQVVVYYDQGQQAVTSALHRAFDYMFSDMATQYRIIRYQDYRLAQVADYLTSIELADMRYLAGDVSKTYRGFYGPQGYFRKNILKRCATSCHRPLAVTHSLAFSSPVLPKAKARAGTIHRRVYWFFPQKTAPRLEGL